MPAAEHFRTHERRPVRLSATIRHEGGDWTARVLVVDLSLGGACIETHEAVRPNLPVQLEILAPTLWDPLLMRGIVIWSKPAVGKAPGRAGVRFVIDRPAPLYALFEVLATNAYE